MIFNQSKLTRQNEIVQKWIANRGKGVLEAVTGFGKTIVGVLIIQEMNKRNPDCLTHVVVPTTNLRNDWVGPNGHIETFKLLNVEVYVVNTYIKEDRTCHLLIMDECHVYSNEAARLFNHVVSKTKYHYILGLTATLEAHHIIFLNRFNIPVIDKVSFEEAQKNKWISNYKIFNVGLDLTPTDRRHYSELHDQFNKLFAIFRHDFKFAMACMSNKEVRQHYAEEIKWDESRLYVAALNWNRNMQKRKSFLYGTRAKMEHVANILAFTKLKTIVFSESVEFIDSLSSELNIPHVVYHSKMGVKAKREALKRFEAGEVNVILTAKALDVGFNVEGLECAIVCSRTSKSLQSTQRLGRTVRFVEGKTAYFINLYITDSQDENWLKKSLRGQKNSFWINTQQLYEYFRNLEQKTRGSGEENKAPGENSSADNLHKPPTLQYRLY